MLPEDIEGLPGLWRHGEGPPQGHPREECGGDFKGYEALAHIRLPCDEQLTCRGEQARDDLGRGDHGGLNGDPRGFKRS